MANFTDILDRPMDEVERPKTIPAGSYVAVVDGQPRHDVSKQKGTPFVEFSLKLLQPMEDVDREALQEALSRKDGTARQLSDIKLRHTLYKTEDSLWRLKEFLQHLGFEEGSGVKLSQAIAQTVNRQCVVRVTHTPSQDGQTIFANVGGTAAL